MRSMGAIVSVLKKEPLINMVNRYQVCFDLSCIKTLRLRLMLSLCFYFSCCDACTTNSCIKFSWHLSVWQVMCAWVLAGVSDSHNRYQVCFGLSCVKTLQLMPSSCLCFFFILNLQVCFGLSCIKNLQLSAFKLIVFFFLVVVTPVQWTHVSYFMMSVSLAGDMRLGFFWGVACLLVVLNLICRVRFLIRCGPEQFFSVFSIFSNQSLVDVIKRYVCWQVYPLPSVVTF